MMWQERQNEVVVGALEFRRNAHRHTEQRQQEQDEERENFSSPGCGQRRATLPGLQSAPR